MVKKIFAASLFALSTLASSAQGANGFKTVSDVYWEIQQPSSSSDAERNQAALNACTVKIAADINATNGVLGDAGSVSYQNVSLVRRYGDWSETRTRDNGTRKHKAGGFAECSYYQILNLN